MTYTEQLQDPRWQKTRLAVMNRDNFTCRMCGDKNTTLNIHHLSYSPGLAWETPLSELITLCKDCHKEVERMKVDKIEPVFFVNI
jgi:5-methylcytosine-specific restriction endonuclease McrA